MLLRGTEWMRAREADQALISWALLEEGFAAPLALHSSFTVSTIHLARVNVRIYSLYSIFRERNTFLS